jgi:hypothetical protein
MQQSIVYYALRRSAAEKSTKRQRKLSLAHHGIILVDVTHFEMHCVRPRFSNALFDACLQEKFKKAHWFRFLKKPICLNNPQST